MADNQIRLLQNGDAYFPAIEAALAHAVYEIYLESYIFENDNTGRRIAEALRRAAFRGVKTHVLIDGFGSNRLPKTMIDYLEAAGIMVMKVRPKISPWTLRRQRLRRLNREKLDGGFHRTVRPLWVHGVSQPGQCFFPGARAGFGSES